MQTANILAVTTAAAMMCMRGAGAAQLFGTTGLDPSFCQTKAVRTTVVYVDDTMMIDGRTEWASKISDKLRATLTPGEPVTVVKLSPANAQSVELWTGCWPEYTADQRAELVSQHYIFSKNPLDGLRDQQVFFMSGFGSALTKIYIENKRPEGDVAIDIGKPPSKQLLRAISSDEGRFANSHVTIRAIIYSDMLENSDLASVYKPAPVPFPNYAEILGSHLRRGVFYAFGVASDVSDGHHLQESAKAFWTASIKTMSGVVGGIGSDLNLSNDLPVKVHNYNIQLQFHNDNLEGKMSLLTDADGIMVDSWVSVTRLTISGLSGSFKCEDDSCKLDATTTSPFVTRNITSERLTLSGKASRIVGQLGIPGSPEVFTVQGSSIAD